MYRNILHYMNPPLMTVELAVPKLFKFRKKKKYLCVRISTDSC
jgi:hypothetical protein